MSLLPYEIIDEMGGLKRPYFEFCIQEWSYLLRIYPYLEGSEYEHQRC